MIEAYEIREGERIPVPTTGDGSASITQQGDGHASNGIDPQGATTDPPAGGPSPTETSPAQTPSPSPGEGEGDQEEPDAPDDAQVNAGYINRRIQRLTAARRKAERQIEAERQQHLVELAQTRGQLEVMQRMLSGAAPPLPETPTQPTGPPQAEQYASHEDYVMAAARYGAQQEFQARDLVAQEQRQREQQLQFQQQLMQREQDFKAQHPDFDTVVRSGLAGKVSPILQQALMLVPDGPAVAYALATQPDLVQRLNTLPPPLVLVELGRLSGPPGAGTPPPAGERAHAAVPGSTTNGTPPAALPPPLTPLSGSSAGAPTGTYNENMDQAAYRAWRKRTSDIPTWKGR